MKGSPICSSGFHMPNARPNGNPGDHPDREAREGFEQGDADVPEQDAVGKTLLQIEQRSVRGLK